MMKLPVTTTGSYQKPAVAFDKFDDFLDLHARERVYARILSLPLLEI